MPAADGVLECSIDNADAMELVQQATVIKGVMFADVVGNNEPVEQLRVTEGVTAADHVGATEPVRMPRQSECVLIEPVQVPTASDVVF